MNRVLAAALLVLAVFSAAGCASVTDGSPQSQPSATGPIDEPSPSVADPSGTAGPPAEGSGGPADLNSLDPCTLVTQDEAEALAQTKLQKPLRAVLSCTFTTAPTASPTVQIELYVGDGAKTFYDTDKNTLGHEFKPVPGVGDQAFAEDSAIFFTVKGVWAGIHIVVLSDLNTAPGLAKLAAIVAGRL